MSNQAKQTQRMYEQQQLASIWNMKFKEAMIHKMPYTKRWLTYMDAYRGDYFKNENLPDYKSDMVSNYVFSIIETIRPIMLDNDPKFQSMPRQPEGMPFSNDLHEALLFEWDRESMNRKLYRELVNTLVLGTSVFFVPWDAREKNLKLVPVNPFNLFPDPLATCEDDAEYMIYATYQNENVLKRSFPKHADKIQGSQINYSELVQDNNRNARIDNQVLVLEIWASDYETVDEVKGNVKTTKPKYPNGKVMIICPELGLVLSEKPHPYSDGKCPFRLIKDYDLPNKFWGEGEVAQLLSPQKHMNDLNNAIIDNAKTTANMPWIVDKNAGIPQGKITARPGLIIRKNPGSEVRREQAPTMPNYVVNAVETFKHDIEQISGVYDTLKGDNATGVYTAQGILALQEAGQVRIRLKVKLLEDALGKIAQLCYSRMKQFWKEDKWIRVTRQDGSYDLKKFIKKALDYDYDIKITAGSTMPVNRGAMLDLMIRLAQTPMPDGQNLVDREAVIEYLPEEIKSALLKRMKGNSQTIKVLQDQVTQLSQQLQQIVQETKSNDEQVIGAVEQIASAIEDLNKQILQLQNEHGKMVEEKKKEDEINKIKSTSYNEGYADAEKLLTSEQPEMMGETGGQALSEQDGIEGSMPEEILSGLETLSDDELALLMEQNPEILELVK